MVNQVAAARVRTATDGATSSRSLGFEADVPFATAAFRTAAVEVVRAESGSRLLGGAIQTQD